MYIVSLSLPSLLPLSNCFFISKISIAFPGILYIPSIPRPLETKQQNVIKYSPFPNLSPTSSLQLLNAMLHNYWYLCTVDLEQCGKVDTID